MLNQNHNVHKRTNSKILLTILCIFGLLFSWSCSCKNNVTGPGNDGLENGKMPDANGGITITPSMSLSRDLMVVNSAGDKTTYDITITVADADFEIADISSEVGLTKDDFTLKDGVLSLTKSFEKLTDNAEKTLTLTVNYKKKSTAGANDTLSKTTNTQTFKIIKAEKYDDSKVQNQLQLLGTVVLGDGAIKLHGVTISGGKLALSEANKITQEVNTSSFISSFKTQIIDTKKTEADFKLQSISENKEATVSSDGKTATFYLELYFGETIETEKFNKDLPLEVAVSLALDDSPDSKAKLNKQ